MISVHDHLPNQEQFVTFPTQNKCTLDNVTVTFPRRRPPLGKSDHDVVHLVPAYKQKLKAEKKKKKTREIKKWTSGGMEELRGCFESTEWSVFFDSCSSHDELDETLADYLRFCEDCVITSKSVRIFPNNKPWVTKDLNTYLNKKKYAFIERGYG